jgi:predicted PurR-regulated permease PerM
MHAVPDPPSRREGAFYPRLFALVAVGLLCLALVRMVQPFVGPILWALLLAFMLTPLNRRLVRALGGRAGLAALLLTIASLLLILLPAVLLGVAFANQAGELVKRIRELAEHHHISRMSDVLAIPMIDRAVQRIGAHMPLSADRIQAWLVDSGQSLLGSLVLASGAVFAGALGAVVEFLLTLFLLFFFLRDGEDLVRRAVRLVPMDPSRKGMLGGHLAAVTHAVVLGTLLTAVAQGVLMGIGFAIVGLPSPVVFGVLTAIASLVPLVGTALVWVPAVVVLFAQGRVAGPIFLVVWSVVLVGMADNVLRPLVVSGRAQIATLPIFLGLMGGLSAFGAIGMVLGPVLVALVIALLRFAEEARTAQEPPVVSDA